MRAGIHAEGGVDIAVHGCETPGQIQFVEYAKFQALTVPCTRTEPNIEPANCYQMHDHVGVGLIPVSVVPRELGDVEYGKHAGADVLSGFLERILVYRGMVQGCLSDDKQFIVTEHNTRDFADAKITYILM